ncbi:MAG: hypothetical protein RLZZ416_302 [Candidatus Parcubacteria bacterium]|jgi:type II secretory pathway component PulM
MSNVLPLIEAKSTWSTYRSRLVLLGALVILVLAILALLSLLPSYLALRVDESAAPAKSADIATKDDQDAIAHAQALLALLSPYATTTDVTEAVRRAITARPKGVAIDRISYARGAESVIIVNGSAFSRENIKAYRAALSTEKLFKTVSVPISDLAGSGSGTFSVTLRGNF